jgi:hypothetical protein
MGITWSFYGWAVIVVCWVALNDLNNSNIIEVAEYAVVNQLVKEPAFKWWASQVICHHNCIVSKVKTCYWHMTHKFGIRVPHSIEEALQYDAEDGTNYWRCAIKKVMSKVKEVAW